MGQGDLELLAFIGSFLGVSGWWITVIMGSLIGSLIGILYMICFKKERSIKIPFGPFLACGAMLYVLFESLLVCIFLGF
jgi:leader peptidase (prepilin peptidase) / N-methyltransferase